MKKASLCICVICFLLCGCSSNESTKKVDNDDSSAAEHYVENNSVISLYYDITKKITLDMKKPGAELKIEGNNCINVLAPPEVTDSEGKVTLNVQAKLFNCEKGKDVKVCLIQDGEIVEDECIKFKVQTISDDDIIDKNHNLMIDEYETNTDKDKDKFLNHKHPEECSDYCHDDGECEDFCDSAIGYRCSKRCTSDDQCIKFQDVDSDDDSWVQMICREDGRCAYPYFKVIYDISKENAEVVMGGTPDDDNVYIDWGEGDGFEHVPKDTENNLKHVYKEAKRYIVKIKGNYSNWTAGCSYQKGIDVYDIRQYGPIGLGYVGNLDDIDKGSFTNCQNFGAYNHNKNWQISARDIPDSKKLTNMNSMFAGTEKISSGEYLEMYFNDPSITRWDTSNVTSMFHTFLNNAKGFNQNIGRWNVSKVTNMNGMFLGATKFNSSIRCWQTPELTSLSFFLTDAVSFNQNLSIWELPKVTDSNCIFRFENGHNGDISLKNYCIIRSLVNNQNIGRDGNDRVKGDCPGYYNKFKVNQDDPYQSTCCGIQYQTEPTVCDPGYDYGTACDGFTGRDGKFYNWKVVVNDSLEKYLLLQDEFKDLTEDTVTCHHLRIARLCYNECRHCYDDCNESDRSKCECICDFDQQVQSDGTIVNYYKTCDGMDTKAQ